MEAASNTSCYTSKDSVRVNVNPTYFTNLPNDAICDGDSVMIFGIYQTVAGTYYDSLTTINACDSVFSINLVVHPLPIVNITGDSIACGSALLDEGAGIPGDAYNWSTGDTTQTITITVSGTYSLTVTTANGCQDSDSINITVNPTYSISTPGKTICDGYSVLIFGIYRTVAGTYYDILVIVKNCDSII